MKNILILIFVISQTLILSSSTMSKKFLTTILLKDNLKSSKLILPKLMIDNDHQLKDFFPFFLQTHILKIGIKNNNKQELSKECIEPFCGLCDKSTRKNCIQCLKGFYKFNNKCFNTCPKNYVADIFKRECHKLNERSKIIKLK